MTTNERAAAAIERMLDEMITEAIGGGWKECWNLKWRILEKVKKLAKAKGKKPRPAKKQKTSS